MMKGLEHLQYEERLRVDLNNAYKYLKERSPVGGALVLFSDRTKGNGHKKEHKKFHRNVRKNLFTLKVTEHWNKLLKEFVESLLEILKIHLDAFLHNLLLGTCFSRGSGLRDLQKSLPTPAAL